MNFILIIHHYVGLILFFFMGFTILYIFYSLLIKPKKIEIIKNFTFIIIFLLHTQLILGFFLIYKYFSYFLNINFSFKEFITNNKIRYQILEHPLMMFISIFLATISHISLKKNSYNKKAIFLFLISFICIIIRIPFNKLFSLLYLS